MKFITLRARCSKLITINFDPTLYYLQLRSVPTNSLMPIHFPTIYKGTTVRDIYTVCDALSKASIKMTLFW